MLTYGHGDVIRGQEGQCRRQQGADTLGLPTVWVPHSYPGCSQHAPDEHLLASVARDAPRLMTGLFWDLGESAPGALPRKEI